MRSSVPLTFRHDPTIVDAVSSPVPPWAPGRRDLRGIGGRHQIRAPPGQPETKLRRLAWRSGIRSCARGDAFRRVQDLARPRPFLVVVEDGPGTLLVALCHGDVLPQDDGQDIGRRVELTFMSGHSSASAAGLEPTTWARPRSSVTMRRTRSVICRAQRVTGRHRGRDQHQALLGLRTSAPPASSARDAASRKGMRWNRRWTRLSHGDQAWSGRLH